jgi:hypothetical protein
MWRGSLTALDGVTKRSNPWRRQENLVSELENHEITKNSLVRIRELATLEPETRVDPMTVEK